MKQMILAVGVNGELGVDNSLLWSIPSDMKHFIENTRDKTVVMGRKTYQSIMRGRSDVPPLKGRRNIVLTRDNTFNPKGVEVVRSIEDLPEHYIVIGGAQVYELLMEKVDEIILTVVLESFPEADTYFKPFNNIFSSLKWKVNFVKNVDNKEELEYNVFLLRKRVEESL